MPASKSTGRPRPRDVLAPAGVVENAAACLRQSFIWIQERSKPTPSLLAKALLDNLLRASTGLEAVLRMAERGELTFQPQTAAELHVWLTIEESIDMICQDRGESLETCYALQRRVWMSLPADWDQWTTEQAETWTRHLLAVAPPGQGALFASPEVRP